MSSLARLPDPIPEEREDEHGTEALFAAFDDLRPRREDFAAGVRQRIQQRREEPRALPPFLRAAAALLPAAMLPKSLSAAVPAIAAKTSAKWLSSALLMPLATLCAIGLTLIALVRGLRARGGDATARSDAAAAQKQIRTWWSEHRVGASFVGVFVLVAIPFAPGPVLTVALLLTALVLLRLWNHLARAGLATQAEIGAMIGRTLELLSLNSVALMPLAAAADHLPGFWVPLSGQDLAFAVPPLLALGALACHALARHGRSYRVRVAWILVSTSAISLFSALAGTSRPAPTLAADGWREAFAKEGASVGFCELATFAQNLRTAGLAGPTDEDLRPFVAALDPTAFDFAGVDALDLGIVDEAQRATWFARVEDRAVTEGRLRYAVLVRSPSELLRFRLLARANRLDERTLALVRDAIVRAFAEPADGQTARGVLAAADTLRELGGDDEALRPRAHELLLALRSDQRQGEGLGFTAMRREPTEPMPPGACRSTWTADAVRLLLRFGPPAGLDLAAVDQHLQRARAPQLALEPFQAYAAFAALAALRTLPGHVSQEPGWFEHAQRLQLVTAACLLVAFAIAATLRARPAASQGAEPLAADGRA